MVKHWKIFACYFRMNLASALEYRASFVSQAFGMLLSNSTFLFFWWVAFSQIGDHIAGYAFDDVLFIWAVASSGFGLSAVLFANVSNITQLIVTGELDTFLLQPCNILLNVLCARTSLSAYGDLAYGFIIMAVFYPGDGPAWLWFLFGLLLSGVVFTAIALAAHTLSFYIGDASFLGYMVREFAINFSIYPEHIYAPAARAIMYSLIPIGLGSHIPLRLLKAYSPRICLAAFSGALLYGALSCWFFYRGLRRYESGNVIVTRL